MIQTIDNTKLNNIEDMLSKTQKVSETVADGMDKATLKDFKDIFDKTLNKTQEAINDKKNTTTKSSEITKNSNITELTNSSDIIKNTEVINNEDNTNTIVENLKNIIKIEELNIDTNTDIDWSKFKDLLTEITSEANVETSLDLTLAKDINEIITQLKDAIKATNEIIEDTSEETPTIEDSVVYESELLKESNDENIEFDETLEQKVDISNNESETTFEQLLATLNTTLANYTKDSCDKENIINNEEKVDLNLNSQLIDSEETINLTENIIENIGEKPISSNSINNTIENSEDLTIDEDVLKELNIESIKAEVDSSANDDLMQNQSPEEYAVKAMINQDIETFELKIDSSQPVQQTTNIQAQTKLVDINPSRIIDQISKHLESLQNNSKISIVLNPESLGKVDIQLLTTKEGLSAQFTVATQEARDLLMKGLEGLKESLTSHGIGVDNVSVKVSEGEKSEYKQDWTEQDGSRGGNKKQDQPSQEEKEKGLFEKMMAEKNKNDNENGNV